MGPMTWQDGWRSRRVRHPRIGRWMLVAALAAAGTAAQAADLQVNPIMVEFATGEQSQAIWLTNTGTEPLKAQVRVSSWTQADGTDRLTPTRDLVASPAILEVAAGEQQLVRLIRPRTEASQSEIAYRLAIDQGADYVEQDLAVTRDGVLICLHDDTLERTTNVEEVFADRSSADPATGRRRWLAVEFTLEEWRRVMDTNLTSVFLMCRAFVPHMKGTGYGRVINLTSIMSHTSIAGRTAYSSSKTALLGLIRALALELAPEGITVVGISPGPFATEMTVPLMQNPEVTDQILSVLKGQQFRAHLEETIQQTLETPTFQAKMQDILLKAAEEQAKGEQGDKGKGQGDSPGGGGQESSGGGGVGGGGGGGGE